MTKLTKKAIRYGRTDGRTDPNYRKASLLKKVTNLKNNRYFIFCGDAEIV